MNCANAATKVTRKRLRLLAHFERVEGSSVSGNATLGFDLFEIFYFKLL
jgi:hypothetical protein